MICFNATPFFQTTVPAYKKNDFGYTVGGPIYIPGHYNTDKQKSFFFWSQEWRRTGCRQIHRDGAVDVERKGGVTLPI